MKYLKKIHGRSPFILTVYIYAYIFTAITMTSEIILNGGCLFFVFLKDF